MNYFYSFPKKLLRYFKIKLFTTKERNLRKEGLFFFSLLHILNFKFHPKQVMASPKKLFIAWLLLAGYKFENKNRFCIIGSKRKKIDWPMKSSAKSFKRCIIFEYE